MDQLRKGSGFTLIELLIAMVILMIGTLGVASLTASIIRGNSSNNKLTMATLLAQNQLQAAKNLGYTNVGNLDGKEQYNTIPNFGAYKRETSVIPDTPWINDENRMKTVTVTVYWDSNRHSLTLQTILAE